MMKRIIAYVLLTLSLHQAASACTIMSCSLNGEVFAAANEDDYSGFARMWFNPPTPERYGSVCFGLPDLQVQAAMNEYGLFYDYTAQQIDPAQYGIKTPYQGDLFFEILGKCKTVAEALVYLDTHHYAYSPQVLLADATGNSVVLNAGTRVLKKGHYQINTNFNISDLPGHHYSCRRYDISEEALLQAKQISVPFFKDILDRTHQEGNLSTIYSNIYDLKRGIIYVYNFHNFETAYVIDLKKELKKGYRMERISDRFPSSFAYEEFSLKDQSMFQKEQILSEIRAKGLDQTIDRYIKLADEPTKRDTVLKTVLLEVGLQLAKETFNQSANGGMWTYWFNLPGAFTIVPFRDKRLDAANRLFEFLVHQEELDQKTRNFIYEIKAYIHVVQGDRAAGRQYYAKAMADPTQTWPISYQRSQTMFKQLE